MSSYVYLKTHYHWRFLEHPLITVKVDTKEKKSRIYSVFYLQILFHDVAAMKVKLPNLLSRKNLPLHCKEYSYLSLQLLALACLGYTLAFELAVLPGSLWTTTALQEEPGAGLWDSSKGKSLFQSSSLDWATHCQICIIV